MSNPLNEFTNTTADWRKSLRQNQFRSTMVIIFFMLIYISIGLLIDVYLYASTYPDAPLSTLLIALVTFKLFPIATLILGGIAGISLLVTFTLYDKLMLLGTEYQEITPETARSTQEKQLYNTVEEMKIAAGLRYMPKVFVINAAYMNAFASGYSEKSAMVAITQGLLDKLNRDELQAVMAHELSHIRHLDIKLTLMASLLANIMLMVLDLLFYNAIYSGNRSNGRSRNSLLSVIIILRYLLPVISMILLLYLSRKRELMADAGAVQLMRTNEPLAKALLKIQNDHLSHQEEYQAAYRNTRNENIRRQAYLFDPADAGIKPLTSISDLFATHPSMEERLKALGYTKKIK
ncbi:MAG: zinc metalloprotease HtpX [Gammaproteobacteria bacterium]|nr:zinc metalloprotease HtpX [Gammaproteobacteria bacterium]